MPSELMRIKAEKEEWLVEKKLVADGVADIIATTRKKIREILPSIRKIHDKKLWRFGDYKSFGDFCLKVLSYTRDAVYKIFNADDIRKELGENGDLYKIYTSLSDGSMAELSGLPPEQAQEVVRKASDLHPKNRPTAATIRAVRKATIIDAETHKPVQPDPEPEEPKICPTCGQEVK